MLTKNQFSSLAIATSTGIAIFSMFFGSGNVVFPLLLGKVTGHQIGYALFGLMITAVGAPLLGLLGCVLFSGDCKQFFQRIGVIPGNLVILLIIAILGPFGVLPRCFIVAYGAIYPYFPELSLFMFSLISGLLSLVLIAKRNLVLPILGLVLSPALLILLVIIILLAIFNVQPLPISDFTQLSAFKEGIVIGYDTMDLLAAIFFAVSIWMLLKEKLNITDEKEAMRRLLGTYWKASVIGGVLLGIIYVGLSLSAALHTQALVDSAPEQVLPNLAIYLMGPRFAILANIAIALACLTTVMSLTVAIGDVIHVEIENSPITKWVHYRYGWMIVLLMVITIIFSNLGFVGIMQILHPIVEICYPAIIVLTVCNILYKVYGFKIVKIPVYATLLITLLIKVSPAFAATPVLIDITVQGSRDAPQLEPANIDLAVGQEYLFVITNPQEFPIIFYYDKLGQSAFTHYLQGTGNVSQQGFTVDPKAKVLWHFQITESGEYMYYANNAALNTKGQAGKITVKRPSENQQAAIKEQVTTNSLKEKEKKPANKRRFMQRG